MLDLERKVQARLQRQLPTSQSVETALVEFIRHQFRLKKPHHAFVRVFLARMFADAEAFLPYLVEMQQAIDPPLEALFQRLQARRAIRPDLAIPPVVHAFKTLHFGLTAVWAIEGPPFHGTDATLVPTVRVFCEGLVRRP